MRILGVPLDMTAIPRSLFGRQEPSTTAAPPPTTNSQATASTPAPADRALRQLMTQYDVRQITPRKFAELVQQLSRDQALPAADLAALNHLRSQLDATQAAPDVTLDLVQFAQDQLELTGLDALPGAPFDAQGAQAHDQFALAAQQVQLLSRFSQLHQSAATPLEAIV